MPNQPNQAFNIPNSQNPNLNPNPSGNVNLNPQPPLNQPPSVVRARSANQPKTVKSQKNPFAIVSWLLFGLLFIAIGAIVVITLLYNQEVGSLNEKISTQVEEIERQKDEKNQIRDIWEDQAASNDKLIISQDNFVGQVQDYLLEISKTIRVVDGNIEVLETADNQRLEQAKSDVDTDLQDLTLTSEESIDLKNINKEKIDTIYLQGFEDQSNRANPRDGVR